MRVSGTDTNCERLSEGGIRMERKTTKERHLSPATALGRLRQHGVRGEC